jgi:WD40 repeat protein/energy-coupling factor transporter ATP-binding protein EcfA2
MSTPDAGITTKDNLVRFPSLAALRAVHSDLLQRRRDSQETHEFLVEIDGFIRKGQATGALLDIDDERWATQSLLDYWANVLYHAEIEPPEATLAEFDPTLAPELDDALCPYQGLDTFREASYFFGRQRLIENLVSRLQEKRLLAVLGPSGSGKSSLVLAGLLPALKAGALPDSQNWHYYPPMVPGAEPLASLARQMQPAGVNPVEWTTQQVECFQQNPGHLVQLFGASSEAPAVLVVDQFEEVFTLCNDHHECQAFVDNLLDFMQAPSAKHILILTMRSDFESQVARLPAFQPLFEQAQVRVTPLNADELREAIEKPAELIGLKFEEGIVNELVQEILGEPAGLPLLQFTLLKLWENRERNRVTWEAYRKLGGCRQALARSASAFYNALIPEEQITAKRILLRLVRPGEGLEVTSNRVRRETLYQSGEARDRVERVLEKLMQARLVRLTQGDTPESDQLEVAHEALVRNWDMLVAWLEEERSTMRQRLRLTAAAEQWNALGKDPGTLLRGSLLAEALHYKDLNTLETEFVQASQNAAEAAERDKEAARQRELEQTKALAEAQRRRAEEQTQAARRLRRLSVGLVVVSLFALVAAGVAIGLGLQQKRQAEQLTRLATSRYLGLQASQFLDKQPDLALLFSLEAYLTNNETLGNLLTGLKYMRQLTTSLRGHDDIVNGMAFSPNGNMLASGSLDRTLRLWDVATRQPLGPPLTGHANGLLGVAFSPDGKTLASGSDDNTIILWDVATHQRLSTLKGHTDSVWNVAFSPDGTTLASGSADQTIILWDVTTHQPLAAPLTGHQGPVESVAFSPTDGKTLASGSADHTIILWDVATRQPLAEPLTGHTDRVTSVVFSPMDGKTLASGSADQTIILWDVTTRKPLGPPLTGHADRVTYMAFSSDGKTLASGSADKTIILWDVTTRKPLGLPLTGHRGPVESVVFSPDGKTLTSSSADNTIILWDVTTHQPLALPLDGHTRRVGSVALSPDGTTLASGSDDNTIILWNFSSAISLEPWLARVCRIVNRNFTKEEWKQYMRDIGPYRATCPGLPIEEEKPNTASTASRRGL